MSERDVRERDILVAPGEYAYVQDLTKGDIVLYVGPTKISLSNTERLVDLRGGRFVPVRADEAGVGVASNVAATHAQYIVLENPPKDPTQRPVKGPNTAIELLWGRRVVVPGPASFPLWPGQRARGRRARAPRGRAARGRGLRRAHRAQGEREGDGAQGRVARPSPLP